MTALCGGGASGPKSIMPGASYLFGNALENLVEAALGVSEAWASLIVFAAAQSIDWITFCATDPPAMPTMTVQDIIDITTLPFSPNGSAFQKLVAVIKNGAWWFGCQCTSTTTPAPPAYPTIPPGAPLPNNPVIPPGTTQPCWDAKNTYSLPENNSVFHDLSVNLIPTSVHTTVGSNPGGLTTGYAMPAGVTLVEFDTTYTDAANYVINMYCFFFNSSGTYISAGFLYTSAPAGLKKIQVAVPAGTAYWYVAAYINATDTHFGTVVSECFFYCQNQSPANPVVPCCPPDPSLAGTLAAIQNMLNAIYAALPGALSSYSEATVHSGLSGNGTITLHDKAVAIKVTITVDSSNLGVETGSPNYLFGRGYITLLSAEAPQVGGGRIVYNPQVFPLPPLIEQIGYSLPGGIQISITELTAGP